MHKSRTPSADEIVVDQRILGNCAHSFWNEFTDQFDRHVLACTECRNEYCYADPKFNEYAPAIPVLDKRAYFLSLIRPYSQDPLLAGVIIRQVESAGWRSFVSERAGRFICSFERGAEKFVSEQYETKCAAVCRAAALLGASGKFVIPN